MHAVPRDHYVPILLAKLGERKALKATSDSRKDGITPILVVAPIDWDFDVDAPKKNVNDHVKSLPDHLVSTWGTKDAFIDLAFLPDDPVASGEHALVWLAKECASKGLSLTAVVAPSRSPRYLQAAKEVVSSYSGDVCLRLPLDEWPSLVGYSAIDTLLSFIGCAEDRVHLVLDLGADLGGAALAAVSGELKSLRSPGKWKSVIVAGAGVPKVMPSGAGLHVLPRSDWNLYRALRSSLTAADRVPTFADYGIASPDPSSDVDPKLMSISATLRYTADSEWLIAKGGLFKASGGRSLGGDAVPPACRLLMADSRFMGAGYGDFESWIEDVEAGRCNGGNASTWRDYATRHHLQLVTQQLSTIVGP